MLHSLTLSLRQDNHLELLRERRRDPVSRLLVAVLICEVLGPVQYKNDLRVLIHLLLVQRVRRLEPHTELRSQLVVEDLNSASHVVDLTNLRHDVI